MSRLASMGTKFNSRFAAFPTFLVQYASQYSMAKRNYPRLVRRGAALAASLFVVIALVLPVHPQVLSHAGKGPSAVPAGTQAAPVSNVKPDARKAKQAYEEALQAERREDWAAAYENYSDAVSWAPASHNYLVRREIARSQLVQMKMDAAERDAIFGKFQDAERELASAHSLDPTNDVVSDRLAEISAIDHTEAPQIPVEVPLAEGIHLAYQAGKRNFDYRGDTRGVYQEVARQFGVEVAFDEELGSRTVHFRIDDVDFPEAMRLVGELTGTFWQPLTKRLFFVAEDTPAKRSAYEISVMRTMLLPASDTADEMTQISRVVRDIAGITRSELNTSSHSLTLRASPHAMAIASDLIDDLDKPASELVLEIEVLEVDRNYAHTVGITPPQSAQVFSVTPQEVQEAQQSGAGLLAVLEQIFGTPSALSGLTAAQIQAELASGQLTLPSTFPFLVFGGGYTTYLARLPGAAGTLSQMLSLVQHGRRILLRAEDGQEATFFVGERYPIALATYSPNLTNSLATVISSQFPITDYPTGVNPMSPKFVATASLRNNGINDLIVANSADNNLSIFLGNTSATTSGVGDGTFAPTPPAAAPTVATGTNPVWIATGNFVKTNSFIDLAVANNAPSPSSISISILLGNGDGTFTAAPSLTTMISNPVAVAAADFNGDGNTDLAVVNSGTNSVSIFLGDGTGAFTPLAQTVPTGNNPSSIAVGDFNGDGKMDFAVTNANDNTVSVFLGNGDGTFTQAPLSPYVVGNTPVFVSAARLATSITASAPPPPPLDLAVANNAGASVSVLLGKGDGTFNPAVNYAAGNGPTSIAVAPFALSGFNDLAVTDQTDNTVSFLLNTSSVSTASGLFSSPQPLSLSHDTNPLSIATADFNGDMRPDMAVAENGTNELSVILDELNFSNAVSNLGALPASSTFPSIQYMDIGLKIKATPRVHPDGDVTLKLDIEISSLTNLSNNGNPVINNDSVEQTVRVKQNETATLAGILEPQVTSAINGTPGLADLPVIGWLGKNQSTQNQDTELLIMITPRIIELTPRKDHTIYAGQGSSEGSEGGGSPAPEPQTASPPYRGSPPSEGPRYTPPK
jgi:Bacterial type II and III secretion system protein/FG-GAP-like repeat